MAPTLYGLRSEAVSPRQLSFHHMKTYGMMQTMGQMSAPRCQHMAGGQYPPMKPMRDPKMGMAEAMMYPTRIEPKVQASHVIQWTGVLAARCLEPARTRTKMFLPQSYG